MTKQELIEAVETAWQVASEAHISEQPMIVGWIENPTVPGTQHPVCNGLRYETYRHLLDAVLRREIRSIVSQDPEVKEPWQE